MREKNTEYFFFNYMQKRHFDKKKKKLQLDKNGVVNTEDKILQEAKSFYQNLYSTRSDQANCLSYEDIFFFKILEKDLMNSRKTNVKVVYITDVECLESLKTMDSFGIT